MDVPFAVGGPVERAMRAHFRRPHPTYGIVDIATDGAVPRARADPRAWAPAPSGRRVFVVGFQDPNRILLPQPPTNGSFRLVGEERFKGRVPVTLLTYEATG